VLWYTPIISVTGKEQLSPVVQGQPGQHRETRLKQKKTFYKNMMIKIRRSDVFCNPSYWGGRGRRIMS
jgi:hypothetical protein